MSSGRTPDSSTPGRESIANAQDAIPKNVLTLTCSRIQVATGWVSHVHEQGKEAAAARGEAPLQEVPHCLRTYHLPATYTSTYHWQLTAAYAWLLTPFIYFLATSNCCT